MRDATGDAGSIPGSRRGSAGGHGNPLQYSCLENPMVLGAWWATVHRVAKSQTQLKRLSTHTQTRKARMNPGFPIPSLLIFPLQHVDFPASYSFFPFFFFFFLSLTPFEFCPNSWAPVYQNSASTPSLWGCLKLLPLLLLMWKPETLFHLRMEMSIDKDELSLALFQFIAQIQALAPWPM